MGELSLDRYLRQRVVLDTQGPLLYIGLLRQHDGTGYWLADADVHDRRDGHSTKEVYLNDARKLECSGVRRISRKLTFVDRAAVVSISALADVVTDDDAGDQEHWLP